MWSGVHDLLQEPARLRELLLKVGSGFVAITHYATPVFVRRPRGENVQFRFILISAGLVRFAASPPNPIL